jgi:hypothetical protein
VRTYCSGSEDEAASGWLVLPTRYLDSAVDGGEVGCEGAQNKRATKKTLEELV